MIAAGMLMVNLHCSWTPQIKTIIYKGSDGIIALESSESFKTLPKHPFWISEDRLKTVLQGVTKIQEAGLLQQLILTAPQTVPAFSPSQIEFLAPHLSTALSTATPEEIVVFNCPASDEQFSLIQGTLSVFPPAYLLLTLTEPQKSPYSSRKFRLTTSLAFSPEEAVIKQENVKTFMAIPATAQGILINFQKLSPPRAPRAVELNPPSLQSIQQDGSILDKEKTETFWEMKRLKEQLQDLQDQVDQQTRELRRLQQTAPQ